MIYPETKSMLFISLRLIMLPVLATFLTHMGLSAYKIEVSPVVIGMPFYGFVIIAEIYYQMLRRRIDGAGNRSLRIILEAVYAEKDMEVPANRKV